METSYHLKNIQFTGDERYTTVTLGISLPNGKDQLAAATGEDMPVAIANCIEKITGITLTITNYSTNKLRAEITAKFNGREFTQACFDKNSVKALAEALLTILTRLPRK